MKERRLLFSVTANDFDVQTFCTGGNGGQHRNAKRNGVRIIHRESGARAEHRDGRDQGANKRQAFEKLVQTSRWLAWHRLEVAKRIGVVNEAEHAVELAMQARHLLIETKDEGGRWVVNAGELA